MKSIEIMQNCVVSGKYFSSKVVKEIGCSDAVKFSDADKAFKVLSRCALEYNNSVIGFGYNNPIVMKEREKVVAIATEEIDKLYNAYAIDGERVPASIIMAVSMNLKKNRETGERGLDTTDKTAFKRLVQAVIVHHALSTATCNSASVEELRASTYAKKERKSSGNRQKCVVLTKDMILGMNEAERDFWSSRIGKDLNEWVAQFAAC